MSSPKKSSLIAKVHDQSLVDFFYLDSQIEELIERLSKERFTFVPNSRDIPFTAQIRGYQGAHDSSGQLWLLKEVEPAERYDHRLYELAYYLDLMLETLSAPTLLVEQKGAFYRATKVIQNGNPDQRLQLPRGAVAAGPGKRPHQPVAHVRRGPEPEQLHDHSELEKGAARRRHRFQSCRPQIGDDEDHRQSRTVRLV